MKNSTHVIVIGLILKYVQGLPNNEKQQQQQHWLMATGQRIETLFIHQEMHIAK